VRGPSAKGQAKLFVEPDEDLPPESGPIPEPLANGSEPVRERPKQAAKRVKGPKKAGQNEPTEADRAYVQAFLDGAADAGVRIELTGRIPAQAAAIGIAARLHVPGKKGPDVLAWIRESACAFFQARGSELRFYSGGQLAGWKKHLTEVEASRAAGPRPAAVRPGQVERRQFGIAGKYQRGPMPQPGRAWIDPADKNPNPASPEEQERSLVDDYDPGAPNPQFPACPPTPSESPPWTPDYKETCSP
jgi:hypothetical protein